jgi:DNA repair exonuclease SbcCD ATPase subunit
VEHIVLRKLALANFKSFRADTFIEFTEDGGFKFLGGDNKKEPRLGANGAGKTSIWDGVVWTLFGQGIKGQKAAELVSWGAKRPTGSVTLGIDGVNYRIDRLGCPDSVSLNGEAIDQTGINLLLGMGRARFLHSVIFGQGVPFFIDLTIPKRGELLDEVLDLSIWQAAGGRADTQATALQNALGIAHKRVAFLDGGLAALPDEADLRRSEGEWERGWEARFDAACNQVMDAEKDLAEMEERMTAAKAALDAIPQADLTKLENKLKRAKAQVDELASDYRVLHSKATAAQSVLNDLENHPNCPTCKQKYPVAERTRNIADAKRVLAETKNAIQSNGGMSNSYTATLQEVEAELQKLQRRREFHVRQVGDIANACYRQELTINGLVERAEAIGTDKANPFTRQLTEVLSKATLLHVEAEAARAEAQNIEGDLLMVDYWKAGFKRVRLFMIQRILTHLEIEVANAADALGLSDWRIEFRTETETKSGTIKQGVQVHITSPDATATWEAWSGGEGQRIRLAVALGFAAMIQRMAGVNYRFEVWDEPSAWLSPEGIEDLLECLRQRADTSQKSVWLLDHRALIHSGFSEIWMVTKGARGSSVEMVSRITQ